MGYTQDNYRDAIDFALNYPPEILDWYYDQHKDLFIVNLLDDGMYRIKLKGNYVRSCLKWKGIRKWRQ